MDMSKLRTGGQLLLDALVTNNADIAFGVPGESYLAVLDALYETPTLNFVVCRQEGGAAMMAEAYGKLTGRPGICFVTRGPGATNASAGVHVAFQDSTLGRAWRPERRDRRAGGRPSSASTASTCPAGRPRCPCVPPARARCPRGSRGTRPTRLGQSWRPE